MKLHDYYEEERSSGSKMTYIYIAAHHVGGHTGCDGTGILVKPVKDKIGWKRLCGSSCTEGGKSGRDKQKDGGKCIGECDFREQTHLKRS